jgi:transposase
MLTRLAADVIIALERDLIVAGLDISNCSINQLASNYRTSYDTVRRHKNRIQSGLSLLAQTRGQKKVITSEINIAIFYLFHKFPWFY